MDAIKIRTPGAFGVLLEASERQYTEGRNDPGTPETAGVVSGRGPRLRRVSWAFTAYSSVQRPHGLLERPLLVLRCRPRAGLGHRVHVAAEREGHGDTERLGAGISFVQPSSSRASAKSPLLKCALNVTRPPPGQRKGPASPSEARRPFPFLFIPTRSAFPGPRVAGPPQDLDRAVERHHPAGRRHLKPDLEPV